MRYEIKYIYPSVYLDRIEKEVLCLPHCFEEIYHERQINNMYLDTPDLADYRGAINGASSRSKTRIRWYGTLWQHIEHPTLEIKYKIGMVSEKQLFPLPPLFFNGNFVYEQYYRELAGELPDDNDVILARLATRTPTVVNTYRRRYFATLDGFCRITIDNDMQFYSLDAARMGEGFSVPNSRVILEVKFDKEYLPAAAQLLQNLGCHIGKNSKYVSGVNAVYYGEAAAQRM
jgi:SPX domain protein involved in polyphosphate accumulation